MLFLLGQPSEWSQNHSITQLPYLFYKIPTLQIRDQFFPYMDPVLGINLEMFVQNTVLEYLSLEKGIN
jgi:hypothetical protein